MIEPKDQEERFEDTLDAVLRHFRRLPELNAAVLRNQPKFDFPKINPPATTFHPVSHSKDIKMFVEEASTKFLYGQFARSNTKEKLSWANQRLVIGSASEFSICETSTIACSNCAVNWDAESAKFWFRNHITDAVTSARENSCRFLLGNPGTGKSTLLKFLIQSERVYSIQNNVFFTRFESRKFFELCDEEIGPRISERSGDKRVYFEKMRCIFDDYYYFIVMRDLLLNYCYEFINEEFVRIQTILPSTPKTGNLISDILRTDDYKAHNVFELLTDALDLCKFDRDLLKQIKENTSMQRLATGLLRHIENLQRIKIKVCVVFDGLDILGPEDSILQSEKMWTLRMVLYMYGSLNIESVDGIDGNGAHIRRISPPFGHHALLMIRPITYDHLVQIRHRSTYPRELDLFEMAPLSANVVLFRAFGRGLRAVGIEEAEIGRFASTLMLLIGRLKINVSNSEHNISEIDSILDIFDGNLRDCIEFTKRILLLLREEARESGALIGRNELRALIDFVATKESEQIAQRRAYRITELLLYYGTHRFHNAVHFPALSARPAFPFPLSERPLIMNHNFRGLVDNVFNYHSVEFGALGEYHQLLLKIRILQICESLQLSMTDLVEKLRRIGYGDGADDAIEWAIVVLRHTGCLNTTFDADFIYLSASNRGKFLVKVLLFQPTYLENVFHQTLFPCVLVSTVRDNVRADSHDRWTATAIRNYFIFMTYIYFVESICPSGALLALEFRIAPRLTETIVAAVERILRADQRRHPESIDKRSMVTSVVESLNELRKDWEEKGIVNIPLCDPDAPLD